MLKKNTGGTSKYIDATIVVFAQVLDNLASMIYKSINDKPELLFDTDLPKINNILKFLAAKIFEKSGAGGGVLPVIMSPDEMIYKHFSKKPVNELILLIAEAAKDVTEHRYDEIIDGRTIELIETCEPLGLTLIANQDMSIAV